MKAVITRPSKRQLLVMLSLVALSGCSTVQSNVVYKSWEQRAYQAYNLSAPVQRVSILPALFEKISSPGAHFLQQTAQRGVSHPVAADQVNNLPKQDLQYIEQYYGI